MISEQLVVFSSIESNHLDDLFKKSTEAVFKQTDCLSCANCCKNHSPIIEPEEIPRLISVIGIDSNQLFSKFVEMDEDGDFVFRMKPCPMLDLNTNKCNIYEDRPKACRDYPHTNMKKIQSHLDILEKNIDICPAAKEIVEKVYREIQ